jgi:adenylate cyclase
MGLEIERRFLLRDNGWEKLVIGSTSIRQAYLSSGRNMTIRVRIKGDGAALTIKSRPGVLRRLEFEYPVPILDAKALMSLRMGSVIEKVRYVVPWGDLVWEIDVFSGENAGLTIAEIELRDQDQRIELLDWIGDEVTTQPQYNNSSLALHPFCLWSRLDT